MPLIIGLHELASPFIGHGVLTVNSRHTDNLRGRGLDLVIEQINALGAGVVAKLDEERHIHLESEKSIDISGNQDVLDVLGIEAGIYEEAA